MDSSVLLPDPDAPTMAAVSPLFRVKSISRRMVSDPVESVTDLNTCWTAIITSDMEGLLKLKRRHFNALVCSACALAAAGSLSHALAQAPAQAASSNLPVVLVVGDSLSAEYGLKRGTGWVALLS